VHCASLSIPVCIFRCDRWLENCRRPDLKQLSSAEIKNKRICGAHFEESQFYNALHNRLITEAVPTRVDVKDPPRHLPTKRISTSVCDIVLKKCRIDLNISISKTIKDVSHGLTEVPVRKLGTCATTAAVKERRISTPHVFVEEVCQAVSVPGSTLASTTDEEQFAFLSDIDHVEEICTSGKLIYFIMAIK
jgi:hypothetical protein